MEQKARCFGLTLVNRYLSNHRSVFVSITSTNGSLAFGLERFSSVTMQARDGNFSLIWNEASDRTNHAFELLAISSSPSFSSTTIPHYSSLSLVHLPYAHAHACGRTLPRPWIPTSSTFLCTLLERNGVPWGHAPSPLPHIGTVRGGREQRSTWITILASVLGHFPARTPFSADYSRR